MLSRLSLLLKTCLELSLSGRDNETSIVSLSDSLDHVWHIVLMAWSIQDSEGLLWSLKAGSSNIDSLSLLLLLLVVVHDVSEPPGVTTLLLGLLLELLDGSLVNESHLVDDLSADGGLTSIDVTDEDQTGWVSLHVNWDAVLAWLDNDVLDTLGDLGLPLGLLLHLIFDCVFLDFLLTLLLLLVLLLSILLKLLLGDGGSRASDRAASEATSRGLSDGG